MTTHHHHGGTTHSHLATTAEDHSDLGEHDCSQYARPTELHWYNDAGHGWLAVTVRDLLDSGVAPDISSYSYHDRVTAMVYLEEDCDAPRYLESLGFTWESAGEISKNNHVNGDSFIRKLRNFALGEVMGR